MQCYIVSSYTAFSHHMRRLAGWVHWAQGTYASVAGVLLGSRSENTNLSIQFFSNSDWASTQQNIGLGGRKRPPVVGCSPDISICGGETAPSATVNSNLPTTHYHTLLDCFWTFHNKRWFFGDSISRHLWVFTLLPTWLRCSLDEGNLFFR